MDLHALTVIIFAIRLPLHASSLFTPANNLGSKPYHKSYFKDHPSAHLSVGNLDMTKYTMHNETPNVAI